MKKSILLQQLQLLFVAGLVVANCVTLLAAEPKSDAGQRRFDSPEDAIKALREAAEAGDRTAVHKIFGPEGHTLLTGDEVQDKANFEGFSKAMTERCVPEPDGSDRVMLNIGTNDWPFPIPLVKTNGQWLFDTDAGKEEIINRHIGHDELSAIGVCRAYVLAQQQYFSKDRDGSGVQKYARKFKSSAGKEDGLYWESTNEPSPFSALVAEAHAEGYTHVSKKGGPHPFHGYYFRILTGQGSAAPGGKSSYVVHGNMTGGFALVAYPEVWGKSGIMTFIVNQDGKVYQKDFAEKTHRFAPSLMQYNPDSSWTLVTDQGVTEP